MKLVIAVILFISTLEAKDLIFGIVPQQSPSKMVHLWLPIAEYLSKETGFNIVYKTEVSISKFEEELYSGKYDFAYMNPYHYVTAHKIRGYEALLRAEKPLQGILVSSKDISVMDQNLFRGKYFLFPSPNAFAATILIKYELKKKYDFDIEKEAKYRYVNSHDSVYKGVARGVGAFGGGIIRTYDTIKDMDSKSRIKILYKSEVYPSHPIAVHPSLSQEEKEILEKAILSIPENLLDKLDIKNIIHTKNSEYDTVVELAKELGI